MNFKCKCFSKINIYHCCAGRGGVVKQTTKNNVKNLNPTQLIEKVNFLDHLMALDCIVYVEVNKFKDLDF